MWGVIFGKIICENGKRYKWSFEITDITSTTHNTWKILIGVIDINNCKALIDKKVSHYGRYFVSKSGSYGFIGSKAQTTTRGAFEENYGENFDKKGHKLTMILDLRNNLKNLS